MCGVLKGAAARKLAYLKMTAGLAYSGDIVCATSGYNELPPTRLEAAKLQVCGRLLVANFRQWMRSRLPEAGSQ